MRIAVLAGGISPESEISALSGKNAVCALCEKYEVILSDQTRSVRNAVFSCDAKKCLDNFDRTRKEEKAVSETITASALDICKEADVTLILLHGGAGENGKIQKILEEENVRFSGSGSVSSALAMDKSASKEIFRKSGIPTPKYFQINPYESTVLPEDYPVVLKPTSSGSSLGIRMINDVSSFRGAIEIIRSEKSPYLCEEMIKGREFTVGILEEKPLAVTEIIPDSGFYDYENKYTENKTKEITPAPITEREKEIAFETALEVHKALGLRNFSRTDMIHSEKDGVFYVLEANSIPGLTELSLFPQMAKAAGLSLLRLLEKMLGLG